MFLRFLTHRTLVYRHADRLVQACKFIVLHLGHPHLLMSQICLIIIAKCNHSSFDQIQESGSTQTEQLQLKWSLAVTVNIIVPDGMPCIVSSSENIPKNHMQSIICLTCSQICIVNLVILKKHDHTYGQQWNAREFFWVFD